ncbi:hypothetical protein [Candidatus Uabimicrobium sp. HlEnr_7]|uniref:hypothetical protein n=1 Tax=Candidatus Uabimicrobium helgolandensis TaxID=3095367 RepID=UPI0035574AB5
MTDLTWCIANETQGRCLHDAIISNIEEKLSLLEITVTRMGWEKREQRPIPRYKSLVLFKHFTSHKLVTCWTTTPRKKKPCQPTNLWEIKKVQRFQHGIVLVCVYGPDIIVYGNKTTIEIIDKEAVQSNPKKMIVDTSGQLL